MRDETDGWNYPQLRKFQACGMVNAARVKILAEQLDARLDDAKIQQFADHKKSLGEAVREQVNPANLDKPVSVPVITQATRPPLAPGQAQRDARPC